MVSRKTLNPVTLEWGYFVLRLYVQGERVRRLRIAVWFIWQILAIEWHLLNLGGSLGLVPGTYDGTHYWAGQGRAGLLNRGNRICHNDLDLPNAESNLTKQIKVSHWRTQNITVRNFMTIHQILEIRSKLWSLKSLQILRLIPAQMYITPSITFSMTGHLRSSCAPNLQEIIRSFFLPLWSLISAC
jgi:hypothetical protein